MSSTSLNSTFKRVKLLLGLKSIIFWDMTPCSVLSCTQRSSETSTTIRFEEFEDVSEEHRVQLNALHGIISQKMILFITTAVKTSDPTYY
jgi:hypothetical protein